MYRVSKMDSVQSSIEINGKNYSLDGQTPPGRPANYAQPQQPVVNNAAQEAPKAAAKRHEHKLASHAQAHKTQASHTLNRKSVKKPEVSKHTTSRNKAARSDIGFKSTTSLIKLSSAKVEPGREERAKQVTRSQSIKRFHNSHGHAPATAATLTPDRTDKPRPKAGQAFDIMRPARHHAKPVSALSNSKSVTSTALPPQTDFGNLLQSAERTNKHRYLEYTPVKKRRGIGRLSVRSRRVAAFSAISLAIVLLAGFIFMQEKSHIELQLADAHAGVNASLPDYHPDGFGISHFSYHPGLVAINYKSDLDGHRYKLVQKPSRLDSDGLQKQLATADKANYQVLHSAGRTIFADTSGTETSAAWVSGGILYKVTGNTALSSQEITRIASSI